MMACPSSPSAFARLTSAQLFPVPESEGKILKERRFDDLEMVKTVCKGLGMISELKKSVSASDSVKKGLTSASHLMQDTLQVTERIL